MGNGSIELDPEKGLNVHLTFCPRCGEEASGLAMMGRHGYYVECMTCGAKHYGGPDKTSVCKREGHRFGTRVKLNDWEKVPGPLCDKCEEEIKKQKEVVAAGGVYFKCDDCHTEGVIIADNELSKAVRADHPAPDPVGVQFTKKDCPVCGPHGIGLKSEDKAK